MREPAVEVPRWTRYAVTPSVPERHSALLAALFGAGAQAVVEENGWLVTHCAGAEDVDAMALAVRAADPRARVECGTTHAVDWSVAWRDSARAHTVGVLTVAPPWLAGDVAPATTIVIDPAMAFGTGDHATTRGVLLLMQDVVRPGDTVADLGSGSAVLAIAAVRLGARVAAAIESDADAIGNAEANVERNGVAQRVKVLHGDAAVLLPLVAPVRVVFANIVSSVILGLLDVIADSLSAGGVAIFSGMLMTERDAMRARFTAAGWRELREQSEGEWWTVCVERAEARGAAEPRGPRARLA